jgi:hypothetical protein
VLPLLVAELLFASFQQRPDVAVGGPNNPRWWLRVITASPRSLVCLMLDFLRGSGFQQPRGLRRPRPDGAAAKYAKYTSQGLASAIIWRAKSIASLTNSA